MYHSYVLKKEALRKIPAALLMMDVGIANKTHAASTLSMHSVPDGGHRGHSQESGVQFLPCAGEVDDYAR